MTEGVTTYVIPDDKREEYFEFVDKFKSNVKNVSEENWNTYNDPMVTIRMSDFTFHQALSIKLFMSRIGAKNITEQLTAEA